MATINLRQRLYSCLLLGVARELSVLRDLLVVCAFNEIIYLQVIVK
jgi:hypothetical protein